METFEHLGFLLKFSEGTPLSQAATFFANSDPDMPAAPVPAAQVHDWISQNISASLEFSTEKSISKEVSQQVTSDIDVTMADANASNARNSTPTGTNPAYYRNTTFVEGFSKTSVVKHASDVKGHSVKVWIIAAYHKLFLDAEKTTKICHFSHFYMFALSTKSPPPRGGGGGVMLIKRTIYANLGLKQFQVFSYAYIS